MMQRIVILALTSALLSTLLCTTALAQSPMHVKQSAQALERGRDAYNDEKYEEAAAQFSLAAQIDPGASHTKGIAYRNLARCLFWLQRYDKAVFWYDVYLKSWPKATDFQDVKTERDAANTRRANPDRAMNPSKIYDRSLLELVETLEQRLDANSPAYTEDGGGTTRLYRRAIELGYSMPQLTKWSTMLRAKLLEELEGRWDRGSESPLPNLESEKLEVSQQRLANLRTLAPSDKEMTQIIAWQRFLDAWGDYNSGRFSEAADAFVDAAAGLPRVSYLSYASGLAHLKAGQPQEALAALSSAAPGAPRALRPYYDLLQAEALISEGRYNEAAQLYIKVARAAAQVKAKGPSARDEKEPKKDSAAPSPER